MSRPQVVTHVAEWQGWCTPCQSAERPLVLTRSGPGGLGSWLAGHGDDDRLLLLTCRVCGDWQVVPPREQDDPEVVLVGEPDLEEVAPLLAPDLTPVATRFAAGLHALVAARTAAVAVPAPREGARPALRVVRGGADPASLALPSTDRLVLVALAAASA